MQIKCKLHKEIFISIRCTVYSYFLRRSTVREQISNLVEHVQNLESDVQDMHQVQ